MRKHIYIAHIVGLLMVGNAFAQFTPGLWLTNNYFDVNVMAAQCYSASVERVSVVDIATNSPSFMDYLLGKNHAKLLSVKDNISRSLYFYCNPHTNILDLINAGSAVDLGFSGKSDFLTFCNLPTNALDETPYFKSQYTNTLGGWHHVWRMLTNMVATADSYMWLEGTNAFTYYWFTNNIVIPSSTNIVSPDFGYEDYAQTAGSNFATRGFSERYWVESNGSLLSLTPARYGFVGEIYGYVTIGFDNNVFDKQGDIVNTNYIKHLTWTNAVNGISPSFSISTNPIVRPPNFDAGGLKLGYRFSPFLDEFVAVYRHTLATNGFKYK